MKHARVLITLRCNRHCAGCCNTYERVMSNVIPIRSVAELDIDFDTVSITGGEPMLFPELTLASIAQTRLSCPGAKVYLYTALHTTRMPEIVERVDGVHYTLHAEATRQDALGFQHFQDLIAGAHLRDKSFQLYVDPRCQQPIQVCPWLWSQVEIKPWMTEDEVIESRSRGRLAEETIYIVG